MKKQPSSAERILRADLGRWERDGDDSGGKGPVPADPSGAEVLDIAKFVQRVSL